MEGSKFNPASVVITLNLSYPDVNKILHALGTLPYHDVRGLIAAIQATGLQQVQAAEAAHIQGMAWEEAIKAVNEVQADSLTETEKQECQTDQS